MILIYVFLFICGLVTGSFLNALIYRLEVGKSLGGRSICPHCKGTIKWYDLFPIISWIVLGGKCRSCHGKISIQYPLVELATGAVFTSIGWFFLIDSGQARMTTLGGINLAFWLIFSAGLIAIFMYDLKHQIIPNEIIYTLLVLGIFYVITNSLTSNYKFLFEHLISGLLAGGFFYTLALVSKGKWMGGGDIKLVTFMGLVLGMQGTIVALYAGFILGAVFGLVSLVSGKKKIGSKIPFGPFLVTGTFISLFFIVPILHFYAKMFM